ncbi:MAG: type IVB secretion system protein IcmH/DotU [Caulobacteraceae bacterium]|nr:type IVB secretion system protein IcmH/DotU [Caulobacteraceae bacterium]
MSGEDKPGPNRTIFQPSPLQQMREADRAPQPDQPPAVTPPLTQAYRPAPSQDDLPMAPAGAPPRNMLMARAAPFLALIAGVRSGRARTALPDLHRQATADISAFQASLQGQVSEETARRAVYALAATADDVALNLPGQGADAAEWAQRSLVVRFFQEAIGGDRFWRLLDEMIARPAEFADLLELYHACMAAGFEGRYRVMADGRQGHQALMQRVYQALPHVRDLSQTELSPRWRGAPTRVGKLGFWAPLALAAVGAFALLLVIYIGLQFWLAASDHKAREALRAINPTGVLSLQRAAVTPPPAPDAALGGLRAFLADEISRNLVAVDPNPTRVRTKVGQLFKSGSEELVPQQRQLIDRIAQALNTEAGDIRVEGYSDSAKPHGLSYPDNDSLSKARADTVAALIRAALKDPTRKVTAEGLGESRPIASNDTPEGMAQNRRVEIVLEPKAQ